MRLSCYWWWISSLHCQSSLRIYSAIASWIHSFFDKVTRNWRSITGQSQKLKSIWKITPLYLTNKEASTVLCSVAKHPESGRARKWRGKHDTKSSVFPTSWVLYRFLSALQQNRAQSRLLYLFYDKEYDNFLRHSAEFSNQILFSKRVKVASAVYCSLIKHAK